jgi:hypothetical protein
LADTLALALRKARIQLFEEVVPVLDMMKLSEIYPVKQTLSNTINHKDNGAVEELMLTM